jgi:hypothetical protein
MESVSETLSFSISLIVFPDWKKVSHFPLFSIVIKSSLIFSSGDLIIPSPFTKETLLEATFF